MKYFVIFLILIGLIVPQVFGVTEELIYGNSSIELLPSEMIPGKPTSFEIKFQYTEGPYALDNLIPIIEVNPASARSYVTIDVEPTGVTHGQIVRIPVTLTVDPQIESEKIFLSISFAGDHFSSRTDAIYKSAWSESAILNISSKESVSTELPSSQDYEFETMSGARCDGEPALCYGTLYNDTTIPIQCDYSHSCGVIPFGDYNVFSLSPLKQFKSGVAFDDIRCKDSLVLVTKHDGAPACVKEQTVLKLINRGWTAESETKKLWKSTDDWNSMKLVRNNDNFYCNSANEELSNQCYSLEDIVFGNGFKRSKHYGWKVYPGAGMILPENSTLAPIYRTSEPLGFQQIDLNAMLDDKIFVNKCESNGGVWNYTFHDCEGLGLECKNVGGIHATMSISTCTTDICLDRGIYRATCVFEYEN